MCCAIAHEHAHESVIVPMRARRSECAHVLTRARSRTHAHVCAAHQHPQRVHVCKELFVAQHDGVVAKRAHARGELKHRCEVLRSTRREHRHPPPLARLSAFKRGRICARSLFVVVCERTRACDAAFALAATVDVIHPLLSTDQRRERAPGALVLSSLGRNPRVNSCTCARHARTYSRRRVHECTAHQRICAFVHMRQCQLCQRSGARARARARSSPPAPSPMGTSSPTVARAATRVRGCTSPRTSVPAITPTPTPSGTSSSPVAIAWQAQAAQAAQAA